MSTKQSPENGTPLEGLLPIKTVRILHANGMRTVEDVRKWSPRHLATLTGIGRKRLQEIEKAIEPGAHPDPAYVMSPASSVIDSPLNHALPPAIVCVLARAGIWTLEQLREAYPLQLLRIPSLGSGMFRQIERAFFRGQRFKL